MKKFIISLINNPKKVIIISLIIALFIGWASYVKINKNQSGQIFNEVTSAGEQKTSLNFSVAGKVKSILVKEGDIVKKGQILAMITPNNMDGSLIQSEAAYDIAKANYQKIISGATGETIDIAKAAQNTAEINLNQIIKQQNILVDNAYRNLLNSTPEAVPSDGEKDYVAPIISGNYVLGKEGTINLNFYYSQGGVSYNVTGLTKGIGSCNMITPQPIGNSGLFIKCSPDSIDTKDWRIDIPNKKASNYISNYNAYELAVQTKNQTINLAQATLDQSKANLASVVSAARPEDVAIAKAQIENALGILKSNAQYNSTILTAPFDGIITSININVGQIILPTEPAITLN